jgi:myo-inositol-1(or 4)-monophosphatase
MRPETECAIRAARLAQEIADSRRGAHTITSKGGIDLVTDADVACEDAIRSELLSAFPDYPVIGEERGGTPADGRPYWLVDPICGTRNYASNIPLYCTNIALVEDGKVILGVIGVGVTGEILYCDQPQGARVLRGNDDLPIRVDDSSNAVWFDGKTEQAADVIRRAHLMKKWYVMQFPSSLAYAYVAFGKLAGVVQLSGPPRPGRQYGSVHSAAGCFVAREAGAIVRGATDGRDWDLSTPSFVIASSEQVYADILRILPL